MAETVSGHARLEDLYESLEMTLFWLAVMHVRSQVVKF